MSPGVGAGFLDFQCKRFSKEMPENECSITPAHKESIRKTLPEYQILGAAGCRLYHCDGERWNIVPGGTGCLVLCEREGLFFLVLLASSTYKKAFKQQLYYDFELSIDEDGFGSFETEKGWYGCRLALSEEAEDFAKLVSKHAPRLTDTKAQKDAKTKKGTKTQEDVLSKKTSVFDKFLGLFKKKPKEKRIGVEDVGAPMNFQHLSHVGFDMQTGCFDTHNIPPEWLAVFQEAGVKKKELRNPETAMTIAKFVNEQTSKGRAPPPVPARRKPPPKPVESSKVSAFKEHQYTLPERSNTNTVIEESGRSAEASMAPALPPVDDVRAQLMSSIRGAGTGILKKAEPAAKKTPPSASNDDMSALLRKALEERKQLVTGSHESSSDSDWD